MLSNVSLATVIVSLTSPLAWGGDWAPPTETTWTVGDGNVQVTPDRCSLKLNDKDAALKATHIIERITTRGDSHIKITKASMELITGKASIVSHSVVFYSDFMLAAFELDPERSMMIQLGPMGGHGDFDLWINILEVHDDRSTCSEQWLGAAWYKSKK